MQGTLPVSSTPPVQPLIQRMAILPYQLVASLIKYIVQKIFGFILRLTVFQLGEYKRPISYAIIRAFQLATCDPRERSGISRTRLETSKSFLLSFGGVEGVAHPADGRAQVRYIRFRSEDAFRRIAEMGGERRAVPSTDPQGRRETRYGIFPRNTTTPAQFNLLIKDLEKFGLTTQNLTDAQGRTERAILLPIGPPLRPGERPPCMIRYHSPGRSMEMDKKFLRWIFAGGEHFTGLDAYIMDSRGTINSDAYNSKKGFYLAEGKWHPVASEGGYYNDAEAVFNKVVGDGYPYNKIIISGYCEGAAQGAYLIKKYHHLGVHFLAENPFDTLQNMVKNFNFVGRWTHPYIMDEIKSQDPAITRTTPQDGFNNLNKLSNLTPSSGKFLLVHTVPDLTNPPESIDNLIAAIGNAGPLHVFPTPFAGRDGHTRPPSESDLAWRWIAERL